MKFLSMTIRRFLPRPYRARDLAALSAFGDALMCDQCNTGNSAGNAIRGGAIGLAADQLSTSSAAEARVGPGPAMTFGEALEHVKRGGRVQRAGWNGKNMFIFLNQGSVHIADDKDIPALIEGVPRALFELRGHRGTTTRLPNINMRSASGATVTGWLASQTDMLAEDWQLA